jgi:hypothetical protein
MEERKLFTVCEFRVFVLYLYFSPFAVGFLSPKLHITRRLWIVELCDVALFEEKNKKRKLCREYFIHKLQIQFFLSSGASLPSFTRGERTIFVLKLMGLGASKLFQLENHLHTRRPSCIFIVGWM